jgi:23S rRNA U2552 (ribose-2'-O)-methylase RlmE/FtsJ
MYDLNTDDLEDNGKKINFKQIKMQIINNINIDVKKTVKGSFLIYKLNELYNNHFTNIEYNINIYFKKKLDKIIIDKNFIEKRQYNKIINLINFYEENKIPYNKSYLVYIDKYNKNLVSQIFTYKNIIDYKFLKYRGTSTKKYQNETLNKLKLKLEDYHFEEFNKKQELLELSYKVKNNLLEENNIKKIPKNIKDASNGIINNLPDYLMHKYNLKNEIDISFCEMWEIYNSHNDLLPMKQNPKVFYLNDISGQSVYASNLYYKHHYSKKYPVGTYAIDMLAVAFNKNNLTVNQKYKEHLEKEASVDILSKKDSKKVIYGADNTGDILFSDNQKWFIQYIKELTKKKDIDLVIADSTSSSNNPMITQRLEFATVCMIARTTGIESNCIVKAKLPYNTDNSLTYSSSGFFVNYLFLYYLMFEEVKLIKPLSSSPNNSEFYIIGKKFRDIEEEHYEKLLNILDNFNYNICFFKKDDIPQEFINQVIDFTDKLLSINIDYNEINNLLLTCSFHKNSVIEEKTQCSKYLDPEYINDIQNEKKEC